MRDSEDRPTGSHVAPGPFGLAGRERGVIWVPVRTSATLWPLLHRLPYASTVAAAPPAVRARLRDGSGAVQGHTGIVAHGAVGAGFGGPYRASTSRAEVPSSTSVYKPSYW